MRIGIIAITAGGRTLAGKLAEGLEGARHLETPEGQKVADTIASAWTDCDALVCIMASGIVVRAIAPLVRDKVADPCVIVMDERGRHAISLLGGHLGGGNALAIKIARFTGGEAVITTASDTQGLVALDLWAEEQRLVADRRTMTGAAAALVNRGELRLYSEVPVHSLPPGLILEKEPDRADAIVSSSTRFRGSRFLVFRPRNLVVGVGCNRGTVTKEFEEALDELFAELRLSRKSIRNLASIDKKGDEPGLLQFAAENHWPIDFFTADRINALPGSGDRFVLDISPAAMKAVGAIGVAEPSALLSAGGAGNPGNHDKHLLSRKRKWKNVTLAVAEAPFSLSARAPDPSSR